MPQIPMVSQGLILHFAHCNFRITLDQRTLISIKFTYRFFNVTGKLGYAETIKSARRRGPLHRALVTRKKKYQAVLTGDSLFLYSGKLSHKYQKQIVIPLKGQNISLLVEANNKNKSMFSLRLFLDDEKKAKCKVFHVSKFSCH